MNQPNVATELKPMKANAHCAWCDKPYLAARKPIASAGICWGCIQEVFPGLLDATDREKLYGPQQPRDRPEDFGEPRALEA